MATPTGHDWGAWSDTIASEVLTVGGDINAESASPIDLDVKSGCEISIDVDYSAHALAAGTAFMVYVLRDINGADYEAVADAPWGFAMPFTNGGTNRRAFGVDPKMIGKFKVHCVWGNTTASATATVVAKVRTADVPIAVA